jgi:hypothetical protein
LKACWLVYQCCRPLQLSPFILCWRSSFEFPPLQSSVLSLSSGFLHFFFPISAGFICKKMKAKTERDDELVRLVVLLRLLFLLSSVAAAAFPPRLCSCWCGWWCCCHCFSSFLVLLLLLLMAAHSVAISFTGGRKSSAGMVKDRRPWSLGFLLLLYCPLVSPLTSPSSP